MGRGFGFNIDVVFGNWLVCGGVGLCRFVGVGLLVGWLGCTVNWRPSETGEIEYISLFIKCS